MRMHIAEGFLPLVWCVFWYLLAIPFVMWGARNVNRIYKDRPEQKLTLAVSGAFIFVLSSLKLPSVTGSSSHPTGTGLSAILYGPATTSLLSTIVLVFQALLLAHGGLTTLGADIFSMGIAGPTVGFFTFKLLRSMRVRTGIQVFAAAVLSDLVTYAVTALQLALAYPSAEGVQGSFVIFFGVFLVTQIPLAIAEGILFTIFFDYLSRTRPKLLVQQFGETK
jgi:cobalt/nickel transport system permease protein